MSDKHVRYSHVEILETHPRPRGRAWRYALSEVENDKLADAADPRNWGAWADEYWTVYPDTVAVRKQVLWTDHAEREASEFQGSIVMIPAGETPEDNINLNALTLANLKGETKTYQWLKRTATDFAKPRGPDHFTGLDDPMIQWINLKSTWKPFEVAGAGPAKFEGINWEPSMSSFEWWNHWPVAQIRSSGRPAPTSDRPSHSSLSHIYWPIAEKDDKRLVRRLLTGLTAQGAADLAPRARSWLTAPTAKVGDGGTARYDAAQRAYVIERGATAGPVRIEIAASTQQPLVNPAFRGRGLAGQCPGDDRGARTRRCSGEDRAGRDAAGPRGWSCSRRFRPNKASSSPLHPRTMTAAEALHVASLRRDRRRRHGGLDDGRGARARLIDGQCTVRVVEIRGNRDRRRRRGDLAASARVQCAARYRRSRFHEGDLGDLQARHRIRRLGQARRPVSPSLCPVRARRQRRWLPPSLGTRA